MPSDDNASRRAHPHRRHFLKATGALGAVGFAGCLGDDDDDSGDSDDGTDDGDGDDGDGGDDGDADGGDDGGGDSTLVVGTASEVSANYAMTSSLSGPVNQNSDAVTMDVRPSDSMAANIGHFENDEIDIGLVESTTTSDIQEGVEPFGDVGVDMRMIYHASTTEWLLVTNNEDISHVDDIESDMLVSPGPAGSRVTSMMRRALELGEIEYEERTAGYGDMGAGIAEGRFDVGLAANTNALVDAVTPGWVTEIQNTIDARLLGIDDEHFNAMNEEPGMNSFEFEVASPDSWSYLPDPVRSFSQVTWMYGTADTPYDPVYAMLETMWENRDQLGDAHALLGPYSSDEHWTNEPHPGFDYHPAAQDFFEEQGLL